MRPVVPLMILTVALACPARAGSISFSVTPALFELKIAPGESGSQTVNFENQGLRSAIVRPEVWDWAPDKSGQFMPVQPGAAQQSIAPWFTVTPSGALVPRGQVATFRVTVSVPKDATGGGHYGVVYLSIRENTEPGQPGVGVGADMAVKILIDTGTTPPQVRTRVLRVMPPTTSEKLKIALEVTNTGDVHTMVEPTVDVLGPMSDFIATVMPEQQRTLLLPGQKQTIDLAWPGNLEPSKYQAMATVYYGKQQAAVDEYDFVVPEAAPAEARKATPVQKTTAPKGTDSRAAATASGDKVPAQPATKKLGPRGKQKTKKAR